MLYACRGEILNEDEVEKYEGTWLHHHFLTVLEVVVEAEVLEDQYLQGNTEVDEDLSTRQKSPKQSVLKWNFPTMGKVFLDTLNDFVKKSTKEVLKSICEKERPSL